MHTFIEILYKKKDLRLKKKLVLFLWKQFNAYLCIHTYIFFSKKLSILLEKKDFLHHFSSPYCLAKNCTSVYMNFRHPFCFRCRQQLHQNHLFLRTLPSVPLFFTSLPFFRLIFLIYFPPPPSPPLRCTLPAKFHFFPPFSTKKKKECNWKWTKNLFQKRAKKKLKKPKLFFHNLCAQLFWGF